MTGMAEDPAGRLLSLEARMEALVEGTLARLFPGRLELGDISRQLKRALEDGGLAGAPHTRFQVRLNTAEVRALLQRHPDATEQLSESLISAARTVGLTLPARPRIELIPDEHLKPRSVIVTSEVEPPQATQTSGALPVSPPEASELPASASGPNAFLILAGQRTVPLAGKAVINLGRRLDNDIILDDNRISRAHAQIRLRFSRYVIYDLGSTGGTYVNGQRITECVLQPGDVITLSGTPLIYGEDDSTGRPFDPLPDPGAHPLPTSEGKTRPLTS